jgi:hypothetical protein
MNEEWEKMEAMNKKIDELVRKDPVKFSRPRAVFMTLRSEEGYNRALLYNKHMKKSDKNSSLLEEKGKFELEIVAASEPSDIIWENRE